MRTLWVIHHKVDYTKSIEPVDAGKSDLLDHIQQLLQGGLTAQDPYSVIVQDMTGFGDQYLLWEPAEAEAWQAAWDKATTPVSNA